MEDAARVHIDRIRKTKFSIGGVENPLTEDLHQAVKNLSAELYSKDVHFLMELIQNAEDNEYPEGVDPSLQFVITTEDITATGASATLLIFNNEKGFSEKNIESVCSVGRSTKKGHRKRGYIGEKGIGFKSVFLITSRPHIFSNGYKIRFNEAPCPHCSLGYIVPEWIEQDPTEDDIRQIYGSDSSLPTTTIVLPLKSDKVKAVKDELSQIHAEGVLFLSKIKRLSVREHCQDARLSTVKSIGIISETDFITRKSIDAESYTVHLSAHNNDDNQSGRECTYYMWKQKFPVRHECRVERRMDVEEWVITLAFPYGERLGKGSNSPGIYAFLPTEMVTNLPFLIQADFILASSRETILFGNKWNQGILDCVPSAFVNAFTSWVKNSGKAPLSSLVSTFRFLPVSESSYPDLNNVRESIKRKICLEKIVPSLSHMGQKFFHRPSEVGRLIPAFWDILKKAEAEGVSLENISNHGIFVLDSAFDKSDNDEFLNFLGIERVSGNWYEKCIRGYNLVSSVSDDTYVELLLFIAENWQSRFQSTDMVNVPLVKCMFRKGTTSLRSLVELNGFTLCVSPANHQAWLLDWNEEFSCMSHFVFMPEATRKAVVSCSKNEVIMRWLKEKISIINFRVRDYANHLKQKLISSAERDTELAIAYAHFLFHSLEKNLITSDEVSSCCDGMLLVDNYGNLNRSRNGVLLPSGVSKWSRLFKSNPWSGAGYIELGQDYLRSGMFAGTKSGYKQLLGFMKDHIEAEDIPSLPPPNVAVPAVAGPLEVDNVFLLLDWIRELRYKRINLPSQFLKAVKDGNWLRTTLNGVRDYRPPSQSFFHSSNWGDILQNGSIRVDIPLVDQQFYKGKIRDYKEELKIVGVMFEFSEACDFIGKHLMKLAETSSLSETNVFNILSFIRYLRSKVLPPDDFIRAVKDCRWLRTVNGTMSPDGAVLFNKDWETASIISDLPFIDTRSYNKNTLEEFKEELGLLGVVVQFCNNHSLIIAHLNPAKLSYLPSAAMLLTLECIRHAGTHRFLSAVKSSQCFKTCMGYKQPSECFIPDPEWGFLLKIFNGFPLIDEGFYGSSICKYREELKQIGVVVQYEDAVEAFIRVFKQKSSSCSITKESAMSLLSCYRKLRNTPYGLPEDLKNSIKGFKWLRTKLGVFESPQNCILFGSEWEHLRPICLLPFIDNGPNWYGNSIDEYKEELEILGVTLQVNAKGVDYVFNSLCLPSDPSCITPSSAVSLLKCIGIVMSGRRELLSDAFLNKVDVKWLKTHAGYRSPGECLLYDQQWRFNARYGPFIDEEFYGPDISRYRKELCAIGVGISQPEACQLLADHVNTLFDSDAIVCIYRFLKEFGWKPEKGSLKSRVWIPNCGDDGHGRWVEASNCVLYDKDKLFGSKLYVMENYYRNDGDHDLFVFFSSAFEVRPYPSLQDYCDLWKDWESSRDRLSGKECCAFWGFVAKHINTQKAEKFLSESISRLPVTSTNEDEEEEILLSDKEDVFIGDDLLLKELFAKSPIFVWYPRPSIPTLSQTKLLQVYRKIGVRQISTCVIMRQLDLPEGVEPVEVEPRSVLIGPGLVKLILGFLADSSLKIEAEERKKSVQCLLKNDLKVLETESAITAEYTLNLSTGETVRENQKKMVRWEREKGEVYVERVERERMGKKELLEYATCFGEVIGKGVMWEREGSQMIGDLTELIKMAYLLDFDEDAIDFLMKSKNLQLYEEDQLLLAQAFSPK